MNETLSNYVKKLEQANKLLKEKINRLEKSVYSYCKKEMLEDYIPDEKIMDDNWNKFVEDDDVMENLDGGYMALVEEEWNEWKNESCSED